MVLILRTKQQSRKNFIIINDPTTKNPNPNDKTIVLSTEKVQISNLGPIRF